MSYRAVIYDMDGTVLNTLDDIADSVNYMLRLYGLPPQTLDQVRMSVGNGGRNLIRRSVPGGEDHPLFEQIFAEYTDYYEHHCQIRTRPYDGILQMMEHIRDRKIGQAIVSNKGDGAVKRLAGQYFAGLVTTAVGEREGIRRKPYPDSALEALRILGAAPEQAVYVGDSDVDYETAKNAGMDLILVDWGFRGRKLLEPLLQRTDGIRCHIVDTPDEIEEIIT